MRTTDGRTFAAALLGTDRRGTGATVRRFLEGGDTKDLQKLEDAADDAGAFSSGIDPQEAALLKTALAGAIKNLDNGMMPKSGDLAALHRLSEILGDFIPDDDDEEEDADDPGQRLESIRRDIKRCRRHVASIEEHRRRAERRRR